jgi:hypothetical protein
MTGLPSLIKRIAAYHTTCDSPFMHVASVSFENEYVSNEDFLVRMPCIPFAKESSWCGHLGRESR